MAIASDYCPGDDLETDVKWVNCGSASIPWGKIHELEIDGRHYILRTDDFDLDLNATSVSIEKDGDVQAKVLSLNAQPEYREFQMDAELKVELTGITTDQYQTPSAQLSFYRRGYLHLLLLLLHHPRLSKRLQSPPASMRRKRKKRLL